MTAGVLSYTLRTPYHAKGNLITNLAKLCDLPLSKGDDGLKIIRGVIPCYIDDNNREVYVFRLKDTKVANIYPDGSVERKASIPAISKTLMSQTKDYRSDLKKTVVKTFINRDFKFRTDLHTHMNANLDADILMALAIHHQIRYPLYYIKKLRLRLTEPQQKALDIQRAKTKAACADCGLSGKYLTRRIDDNTYINFADFILNDLENAAYNIPKIRASLTILKDGQAVFTNLEKVYLYRYVFTKGKPAADKIALDGVEQIPDADIVKALRQMNRDRQNPAYADLTLLQDKLLWIARSNRNRGVKYLEISDTSLVKPEAAAGMLAQVHAVMPAVTRETGVTIRFLAALRRIPLTIIKDKIAAQTDTLNQLRTLKAVAIDPYVAGSDIVGEEMNDIRDLRHIIREIVAIAAKNDGFTIRIHAGENDSLRDNVANSLQCVKEALADNQPMPRLRIGHGLYTANLKSKKGQQLIRDLKENKVTLEFQLTSNVRLNNLSSLKNHPLKQYLQGGIYCVQGTDGGAIYGTDSIDEQLSLEKLLDLSYEELCAMHRAETDIMHDSLQVFARKSAKFNSILENRTVEEFLAQRIAVTRVNEELLLYAPKKLDSAGELTAQIREMPTDKVPVIILGGSFNSSRHSTVMKEPLIRLVHELTEALNPDDVFFVVGHRVKAYEKKLIECAENKFDIFAMVPTQITAPQAARLKKHRLGVRISIEPTGMGLYKSLSYEIFKRRPSVVIALDGNSAGANAIQEARNGKKEARIYVSTHARTLCAKASSIQGYVSTFDDHNGLRQIVAAVERVKHQMN